MFLLALEKVNEKKIEHKLSMNIKTGVNFINILCSCFLDESALPSFSLLHFGFVIFWQKNIGKKPREKY